MNLDEAAVLVHLAGKAAESRAHGWGDSQWHRPPTEHQSLSYHESGHLVVAETLGLFAHWGVVDLATLGGGRAHITYALEDGADSQPSIEPGGRLDGEKIAYYCDTMADDYAAYESLRESLGAKVDAIVEAHWLAIEKVADVLDREGVIRRPEILSICAAFPPAEGR